jgi:hypothetical protein
MSIWSDNPEWFDEWIEAYALDGGLGQELQIKVEQGELTGSDLWAMKDIDPKGELGSQASEDYCTRFI